MQLATSFSQKERRLRFITFLFNQTVYEQFNPRPVRNIADKINL